MKGVLVAVVVVLAVNILGYSITYVLGVPENADKVKNILYAMCVGFMSGVIYRNRENF